MYIYNVGNEGSAFVEVLVGRSCAPEDYQVSACMGLCSEMYMYNVIKCWVLPSHNMQYV